MPGDIPRADQLGAFGGFWWKRSFFGITSSLLVKVLVKGKVLVASQLSLLEKNALESPVKLQINLA